MQRIEMIGAPIDHVLSPGILQPDVRAAGEPYEVVPVEVRPENWPDTSLFGTIRRSPD